MLMTNLFGALLIGGIIWWFWLWKPDKTALQTDSLIHVLVENGIYRPAHLTVPLGRETTLRFLRKDTSACAGTVVFEEWGIAEELPVNQEVDVKIYPGKIGSFPFSCQMNMYRGKLHVVEDESNE